MKIVLLVVALLSSFVMNAAAQTMSYGTPNNVSYPTVQLDQSSLNRAMAQIKPAVTVRNITQRVEYVPTAAEIQTATITKLHADYAFWGLAIILLIFFIRMVFGPRGAMNNTFGSEEPRHYHLDVGGKVCHVHSVHGEVTGNQVVNMDLDKEFKAIALAYAERPKSSDSK